MCVKTWGSTLRGSTLSFFSRQSLSVNLGLTDLARLLSSKVQGILLQLQMLGLAVPSLYVNGSLDTHETTLS